MHYYKTPELDIIKGDIKVIKLIILGLLVTHPIYYTSLYFASKHVCKQAYENITEYINNHVISYTKKNKFSPYDSSDNESELDNITYIDPTTNVPDTPIKKGLFNYI